MRTRILIGFALVVIFGAGIVTVSYQRIARTIVLQERVRHASAILEHVNGLANDLAEVEAAQRAYLLTDEEQFLKAADSASEASLEELASLHELAQDRPSQQQRLNALNELVRERLAHLDEFAALKRSEGIAGARNELRNEQALADKIRSTAAELQKEEKALLESIEAESKENSRRTARVLILGSGTGFLLLTTVAWLLIRQSKARTRIEETLVQSNEALTRTVRALASKTGETRLLGETGDLLQSCLNLNEARDVLHHLMPQLLPGDSGGLYVLKNPEQLMQPLTTWGQGEPDAKAFGPEDCWALRRGRPHNVEVPGSNLICRHLNESFTGKSRCLPLVAQNQAYGLLHILHNEKTAAPRGGRPEAETGEYEELTDRVAERISLGLANIRLRDSLRDQAIRDPLTGLFNRRYMEESLERELRRSIRHDRPVAVIMIDVDHFKQFNDRYGHPNGDALLRSLGRFLVEQVREEDIACRYGGEEFLLVAPEAALEIARDRADRIREQFKTLSLMQRMEVMEPVTLSAGIAAYPEHGSVPEALIRAADRALYIAKHSGRDQVVVARPGDQVSLRLVSKLPT
ncbi:MAG TPA: diguanylate cyclase [Candidatus Sulfotelmatobacter sp.]|nr:diguanylate cyclase [Candidatus Sulfotelmatobacter sp.]